MDPPEHKTRRRFENPGQLRFLTFSCHQRLQLFNNDTIKDAFVEHLRQTQRDCPFGLIAWVVMPEHVHLLIEPDLPLYPVSAVLKQLKGGFANRVLHRWRELGAPILPRLTDSSGKLHFWLPGGGHDRNLYSPDEAEEKFHYTHNNPVKRRLVVRATGWRWSSARWYAGMDDGWNLTMASVML